MRTPNFVCIACFVALIGACSGGTFTKQDDGGEVTVEADRQFTVTLPASNRTLAPEHRFSREPPEIDGEAVEFIKHEYEPPPRGRDGAMGLDHYIFQAVEQGKATLQFWRVFDRDPAAWDRDPKKEKGYSLTVSVP